MTHRLTTYSEFWLFYLREHSKPGCRGMHYLGTTLALANLVASLVLLEPWLLLSAVVCGYGFAWIGHFVIQKNRPATFRYPLWSLISDFRMYFTWLGGGLATHLARAGIRSDGMVIQPN